MDDNEPSPGLRDMFAANALPVVAQDMNTRDAAAIASRTFDIADAMMAERKKRYAGK